MQKILCWGWDALGSGPLHKIMQYLFYYLTRLVFHSRPTKMVSWKCFVPVRYQSGISSLRTHWQGWPFECFNLTQFIGLGGCDACDSMCVCVCMCGGGVLWRQWRIVRCVWCRCVCVCVCVWRRGGGTLAPMAHRGLHMMKVLCVCVWERKRERDRKREGVCVCTCVCAPKMKCLGGWLRVCVRVWQASTSHQVVQIFARYTFSKVSTLLNWPFKKIYVLCSKFCKFVPGPHRSILVAHFWNSSSPLCSHLCGRSCSFWKCVLGLPRV